MELTRRHLMGAGGAALTSLALSGERQAVKKKSALLSGLYAYPQEYLEYRAQMKMLGVDTIRVTDAAMDNATWQALREDGYAAHITVSTTDRADCASETAWIAEHIEGVDAILSRYPFRWVESWNEPNFAMWYGASPEQKQGAYGRCLVATYRHVKKYYPRTKVVGFAAGGSSAAAPDFIRGVFDAVPTARKAYDIASFHPYISPVAPERVKREDWGSWSIAGQVRAVRELGVSKPLWFSEIGWQISAQDGGYFTIDNSQVVSPELQAAYAVRMFVLSLRLGIQRLHHMYVKDTDNFNGGFFTPSGPRPQALALAAQHRLIPKPTKVWRGDGTSRIRSATGITEVAWSGKGKSLDVGRKARVWDLYGQPVSHRGRVELSPYPIYIRGRG